MLRVYCQRVLNFNEGIRGVVVNSRILGPFSENENFNVEDFSLIEQYTAVSYGNKLKEVLSKNSDEEGNKMYFYFLIVIQFF